MTDKRSTASKAVSESARPYRGRRMSWEEFYKLTARAPIADNDNDNTTQRITHAD
ncbi:hypothetical protein NKI09_15215 [Mesorhizobium sp. M0757]|uniref:hypothetical protein n=1 Tax=Mesorhizobium sp. M0757 TaxID=2956993 RepID=UPI00333BF224